MKINVLKRQENNNKNNLIIYVCFHCDTSVFEFLKEVKIKRKTISLEIVQDRLSSLKMATDRIGPGRGSGQ